MDCGVVAAFCSARSSPFDCNWPSMAVGGKGSSHLRYSASSIRTRGDALAGLALPCACGGRWRPWGTPSLDSFVRLVCGAEKVEVDLGPVLHHAAHCGF